MAELRTLRNERISKHAEVTQDTIVSNLRELYELGQKYRVAQCFTYHLTRDGKIDFMRQYLDTDSVRAQLK